MWAFGTRFATDESAARDGGATPSEPHFSFER